MKFLVADDHPLVRKALSITLEKVDQAATILQAADMPELMGMLNSHPDIDLVLMDLTMPGTSGLESLEDTISRAVPSPVAVVSADERPMTALHALRMGAVGYLPKSLPEDVMRAALALILSGGVYVPQLAVSAFGARLTLLPQLSDKISARTSRYRESPCPTQYEYTPEYGKTALTPRQSEVLDLVIEGHSNREIAEILHVAEATVKVHITAILRAYDVRSRAKAIHAARREFELTTA